MRHLSSTLLIATPFATLTARNDDSKAISNGTPNAETNIKIAIDSNRSGVKTPNAPKDREASLCFASKR